MAVPPVRAWIANAQCTYHAPPGPFTPRVGWKWEGSTNLPQYNHVLMTPVVIPLSRTAQSDTFPAPAVVFNTFPEHPTGLQGSEMLEVQGVMRAVRGEYQKVERSLPGGWGQ